MNINRHNYETFFLLYVDKELSKEEMELVDNFIQLNPDLQLELNLFKQTVLPKESPIFPDKNILLKSESISEKEEQLLLYLDNELSPADRAAMQQLVLQDIAAQNFLQSIASTKLVADEKIVFPNKATLYKEEGGKIIYFNWRKLATAAILFGIGTWATLQFINTSKPGVKDITITENPSTKLQSPSTSSKNIKVDVIVKTSTIASMATDNTEDPAARGIKKQRAIASSSMAQKEMAQKESNNLPKPLQNFNVNNSNQSSIAAVLPSTMKPGNKIKIVTTNPINNNITTVNATESSMTNYAINTVYTNNSMEESDNNGLLSINNEKVKKTKLGGFLRKVKRVIERNTNIKTGNGIKVAGFDIAIQ